MNFNWTDKFFNPKLDSWDNKNFEAYGLTESEIVYAWALTQVYDGILKDIEKYVLNGAQQFWQVNEDIFTVKGDKIIVSNPWQEIVYELPFETFKQHVNKVLKAKKCAL